MYLVLQTKDVRFTPARDLLGHTAALDWQAEFPLLGVPLRIRSNSPDVIATAQRSFERWRMLAPDFIAPGPTAQIDVIVHSDHRASVQGEKIAPFIHRLHGDAFVAASGPNLLTAQLKHGTALAFVHPDLVAADAHFRYSVLECLGLLLTSRHDRVPIHAGAVMRNGCAVLLFGQSTAGKSTLCYACVRQGFQLLDEDVVYVSLKTGLRIWGNPWRIHLLQDAPRLFPELIDTPPEIQANGKLKLAVDVVPTDGDEIRFCADRAVICMLERHDGQDYSLEPVDPRQLIAAIGESSEPGFDFVGGRLAAAHALAQEGVYRLRYGTDLGQAVALLETLTD